MDVTLFQAVDGKALCKMTKDDMTRLTSAYNADILLSHLNYLKQSKARLIIFNNFKCFTWINIWHNPEMANLSETGEALESERSNQS